MKFLKNLLLIGLVSLPGLAMGKTDCRYVEYPDHFDAVCVGDEQSGGSSTRAVVPAGAQEAGTATKTQTTMTAGVPASGTPATPKPPGNSEKPARGQAAASARTQAKAQPVEQDSTPADKQEPPRSPYVITQHRPDKSIMEAARVARARLIMEERLKAAK